MHVPGIVRAAILYPILCSVLLHGQRPEGEIRLEVKDPSGAAMEASGKIESSAIGGNRAFQTDAQGVFKFGSLPYGRYRVQVSKKGFATQSVSIDIAVPCARLALRHDDPCGRGD